MNFNCCWNSMNIPKKLSHWPDISPDEAALILFFQDMSHINIFQHVFPAASGTNALKHRGLGVCNTICHENTSAMQGIESSIVEYYRHIICGSLYINHQWQQYQQCVLECWCVWFWSWSTTCCSWHSIMSTPPCCGTTPDISPTCSLLLWVKIVNFASATLEDVPLLIKHGNVRKKNTNLDDFTWFYLSNFHWGFSIVTFDCRLVTGKPPQLSNWSCTVLRDPFNAITLIGHDGHGDRAWGVKPSAWSCDFESDVGVQLV